MADPSGYGKKVRPRRVCPGWRSYVSYCILIVGRLPSAQAYPLA